MERRSLVPGLCGAVLLTTMGLAAAHLSASRSSERIAEASFEAEGEGEGKVPPALARRLDRLKALPGAGGENTEGRTGFAVERFLALAYPGSDIPFESLQEARAAAVRLAAKASSPDGPPANGVPGAWASVGPLMALYPATDLRNSAGYVPAKYVAGGRATAVAIDPNCQRLSCRIWIFAAGGGVWRAANAVRGLPIWEFISPNFGIQSGSSITIDPNDPTGNTLYVGTGEANASADSAAGVGMYKSTDGGTTWTGPLGVTAFAGRAIGSIEVVRGDPLTIYAATTRGVLGVSSVNGGGVSLIPGAPAWGLYKSTDGGSTWTFLHNGALTAAECDTVAEATAAGSPCSIRGVRRVALDPTNPAIVYAGSYSRGVWRSPDGGATWTQIQPSLNSLDANMRPEIAVTRLGNGDTRMYIHEGSTGPSQANPTNWSRLFRSDSVATGVPVFADLTSNNVANPGYATFNLCTGQCWYDSFVYTPPGHPDIVYVGGSYSYGEQFSNKRGVVLSTDGGVTATDMTMDATDPVHPNGLHPDQHALVTHPTNPFQFFEVNDGGLMRSSGQFADVSSWCDTRGLTNANQLARCRQLLSRVPTELVGLNKGIGTLQFQSLSVSPFDPNLVQGGTQDNGTWQTPGNPLQWINTMIGDGGQSGFDVGNPAFRFHTFFNATPDVNFAHGAMEDWNWIGDPIFGTEPQSFYVPIISDPVVTKTMFVGTGHVWRTKTWGMGSMTLDFFREQCNEWFGLFTVQCGDWEPLGGTTVNSRLTGSDYGPDRTGGFIVAVERATSNASTLWAATQTGRVFISRNVDTDPPSGVTFTRLDSLAANDPNRFVSGIHIDPSNPNRAWIAYSGFSATTPATPGHVFQVTYDPAAGTATWVDISYDFGDLPATDVARDDARGDLYVSTDYGVFYLASGATGWVRAGTGLPNVEVAGLTIVPGARRLYAATHGLSAWMLGLP